MCQFKEFKEKLFTLISNNFKINIYGPNGYGKTHFILEVIKVINAKKVPFLSNRKHMMYLKLSDFLDLESFGQTPKFYSTENDHSSLEASLKFRIYPG